MYIRNLKNGHLTPIFLQHNIHLVSSTCQHKYKWILCTEKPVLNASFQDFWCTNITVLFRKNDSYNVRTKAKIPYTQNSKKTDAKIYNFLLKITSFLKIICVQNQLSIRFDTWFQRRFQGGSRGVAPPPCQNQGGARDPPVLPTPWFFATPLIDHQEGAGDPPVIFDIFDSGFYMICFNIVIYVWFLIPLFLLVIKFLFIF